MLNELLIVERGARQACVDMAELHSDVKDCRRMPTLLVRLGVDGHVSSVRPVPSDVKLWALRDGQQNSFPFVQKLPLLAAPIDEERRKRAVDRKNKDRRAVLLALVDDVGFGAGNVNDWPGAGLLNSLQERQKQLAALNGTDAGVVPATIDRFLLACTYRHDDNPNRLLHEVTKQLLTELRQSAQDDWLEVAIALLLGKFDIQTKKWKSMGALLFEADGFQVPICESHIAIQVSGILMEAKTGQEKEGFCGLTGDKGTLFSGNFPQPNLPVLGQTYLFAKNTEIPANDRYGRFAAEAMPVGNDTAIRLAAALRAVTTNERRGVTWRDVPGEAPKQKDLLLAFVEAAPDAPAAGTFTEDEGDEDYSEESPGVAPEVSESVAAFEKRTERLIEAVRGKVKGDFRRTPVHVAVFRKVDPANRKVVYSGSAAVAELYDAATDWAAGERNIPPWITLPVLRKGETMPHSMVPPHVAPLGVVAFSKQIFLRNGKRPDGNKKEQAGLPAAEAMGLFLAPSGLSMYPTWRRVERILRMVLARRTTLVSGTSQALLKGTNFTKDVDLREALRTVTLLGVLLHKLARTKEAYMGDMAFKLGQLLAAADVVHTGYCADVRGGVVPPSLLGNQVFTMAQTTPVKALALFSRRWKPYDGWAKKADRERDRAGKLVTSKNAEERQRGWSIKRALRHAREMRPIADELHASLAGCEVNDTFRAELLLGYIAGLPKAQREDGGDISQATQISGQEE